MQAKFLSFKIVDGYVRDARRSTECITATALWMESAHCTSMGGMDSNTRPNVQH